MTRDPVRAIADAILYEGYVLWPYRRSARKNQRRFTFGGVYPPAHASRHHDDPALVHAEVLVEGEKETDVAVTLRFLHVVERTVARRREDRSLEAVDELIVGGERHLAWQEAVEREITVERRRLHDLGEGVTVAVAIPAAGTVEDLGPGAIVRAWRELSGALSVGAERLDPTTWRIAVTVRNTTSWGGGGREDALRQTFCSTHLLLRTRTGAFVSLTDPPPRLQDAARACENVGTWPVLVGADDARDTVLASPIILEDHPRIAPESPGDLFDGGEIDELLALNILALTDAEKAEMAASDPRVREILERTERLTPDELMALHGTVREIGLER
jgi:hydrogenase maturation protease